MPILLKTQVDRTAKTPIQARRARVGGLCGFRSSAERVTHREHENRTLRRRAGVLQEWQAQKKDVCERISAEGEAASGEAGERPDAFQRQPVHFCPQCGQFRGIKMALFCGCQKWNDAIIAQKSQNASKIKDNFDAIMIFGSFEHENRRTKPPHSLDGRYGLAAGAGTLQKRRMQHTERVYCKGNSVLLRLFTERVRWRLSAEDPW